LCIVAKTALEMQIRLNSHDRWRCKSRQVRHRKFGCRGTTASLYCGTSSSCGAALWQRIY
jgi:hypothetical protein